MCGNVENLGGRMRRMKKRGPNVLYDLNDLLFFLTIRTKKVHVNSEYSESEPDSTFIISNLVTSSQNKKA